MKKEIEVLLPNKTVDKAELFIDDRGELVIIKFKYKDIEIVKEGELPFYILVEIRKELEKINYFLLCNCSRIDVYPSRMSAVGFNAYQLKHSQQALLTDLVNILDGTDKVDLITTVEKQKEYCLNILQN